MDDTFIGKGILFLKKQDADASYKIQEEIKNSNNSKDGDDTKCHW